MNCNALVLPLTLMTVLVWYGMGYNSLFIYMVEHSAQVYNSWMFNKVDSNNLWPKHLFSVICFVMNFEIYCLSSSWS